MDRRTKSLAVLTRAVAAALTLAVAAAGVPAAAEEARDQKTATPSALRQSIDRAVEAAPLSDAERADVAQRARRLQTDPVAGQAQGGGGNLRTIVTLLGVAASVWTTWYMVKYLRDTQEQATGQ